MDKVGLVQSPFVGRDAELATVVEAVDASREGRGRLVLIGGESGVGKTRLVTEAMRMVDSDTTVLFGSALDITEKRPFSPVIDALRRFLEDGVPTCALDAIRPWGAPLSRLLHLALPEAAPAPSSPPTLPQELPEIELLCQVIDALAGIRPLVLVLEDLQWADHSTRDLLVYALANLDDASLTILTTYRSEAITRSHPVRQLLSELVRNRRVVFVELRPVDRQTIGELVAAMDAGTDAALERVVWQRSEGNFFLAGETLRSLQEGRGTEVPATLRQIVLGRVDVLPPAAQRVLHAVATADEPVRHELLATVVGLQDTELLHAIRSAVDAIILTVDADRSAYQFRHALYQEVIASELLPGERQTLHRRFAEAITVFGDSTDPRTTTLLAHHWDQAHQWPAALEATVAVAEQALASHGFVEAAGYWRRSLQLIDLVSGGDTTFERTFLLERAATAASLAGEHLEAVALMEERIRVGTDAPEMSAWLHQELARFLEAAGKSHAALTAHRRAVSLHEDSGTSSGGVSGPRARALNGLAHALLVTGQYGSARSEAERAVALARKAGDGAEMARGLATLGFSLAYLEDPDAGVAALEKSLRIAEEMGGPTDIARVLVDLSALYAGPLNQLEEALALARRGVERVTALGLERTFGAELRAVVADTLFRLGRWADGEAELALALAARPTGHQAIELRLARAKLLVGRGEIDEAQNDLEALEVLLAESIGPRDRIPLLTLRAGAALWQGRSDLACEAVLAGLETVDPDTDDLWLAAPLVWHGLRALGDEGERQPSPQGGQEARSRVHRAQAVFINRMELLATRAADAPDVIARWVGAYLALSEGEITRARRTPDPGPWLRAANSWEHLGHPYPTAYAWFRHADALFALRSRSAEASSALRRAYVLAYSLGAQPLLALITVLAVRARVALQAGWVDNPTDTAAVQAVPAPSELDTLSERERVVLSEIAEGRSNREIAQRLFISEKTVSAHVSHILTKLGVRSRVQASAVFYNSSGRSS